MSTDWADQRPPPEAAERFCWRAHPARERPVAALLATLVIGALGMLCAGLGGVGWGVLAVVVLVLSLHRFYFPSRFVIGPDRVVARYLLGSQGYGWPEIRRFQQNRYGVFLSTRSRPSRLDAYRGMHLLFGRSRDEVVRRIRERLQARGAGS